MNSEFNSIINLILYFCNGNKKETRYFLKRYLQKTGSEDTSSNEWIVYYYANVCDKSVTIGEMYNNSI